MRASLTGSPAVAAKVASHPWSVEELYERVIATVDAYDGKRRTPPDKSGGVFVCAVLAPE
jgi:hypothetical protein